MKIAKPDIEIKQPFSRSTCLKIAVLFFLLTQAEKRAFSQLKALISAKVEKKKRSA